MNLPTPTDPAPRPALPGLGDASAMAAPKKAISTQSIILVVLLAVSASALLTMRHLAMKSGMDMSKVTLPKDFTDTTVAAVTRNTDFERVMEDLQRLQKPMDVALGDLGARPFGKRRLGEAGPSNVNTGDDAKARENAARQRALQEAFEKLHLQSVMGGKVSVARINGQNYRVGDTVDNTFEVVTIGGREVVVRAGEAEFTLVMEHHKGAKPAGRR